jgi:hypothetical protein
VGLLLRALQPLLLQMLQQQTMPLQTMPVQTMPLQTMPLQTMPLKTMSGRQRTLRVSMPVEEASGAAAPPP